MPRLTFLGHSSWLIEGARHSLIVDPFLNGNPKAALKPEDIKVDFVVVTHGHGDHVGDGIDIARRNNATLIANFEVATYCGHHGCETHAMHIGGAHRFPFGRVKLTIAHHGSGISREDGSFAYGGNPCGVVLTVDGKTTYHAGDTGLFLDMKLIGERDPLDVALLPIGDNYTMGVDDAVAAAGFLKAKLTVPMHYGTFPLIDTDPKEFVDKVRRNGQEARVVEVGESLEI